MLSLESPLVALKVSFQAYRVAFRRRVELAEACFSAFPAWDVAIFIGLHEPFVFGVVLLRTLPRALWLGAFRVVLGFDAWSFPGSARSRRIPLGALLGSAEFGL